VVQFTILTNGDAPSFSTAVVDESPCATRRSLVNVDAPGTPPGHLTLADRFRKMMAGVATPVSVVTSMNDGQPHGTTVSAFASLSKTPPMVVVALDRTSDLLALIRKCGRFGVNVLGADQAQLALAFARKGGTGKFDGVHWEPDHGLPRLPGATGWLACETAVLVDGGDHVLALGTVLAAETAKGLPLTYHDRIFGTHTALESRELGVG
jgi:flavin reductase (DIM6/NTAB) family NADH-FMN oxidoreductase RutF